MTEQYSASRIQVLPCWRPLGDKIPTGEKDIDLRTDDERFRNTRVGDVLVIARTAVRITDLRVYPSLGEAIVNEDFKRIAPGFTLDQMLPLIPRMFPRMQENPRVIAFEFVPLR